MGDSISIWALLGIILLEAVALLIALLAIRRKNQPTEPIQPNPPISNQEDNQTANQELLNQMAARLAELEQRLSTAQNNNAGVLNRQISALNTKVSTVDDNMQQLQRLFRNVKLRGGWGEVQLAAILAEFLSPAQYEQNVAIDPEAAERVEFALKLPLEDNTYLWLPIDAKCPVEDFEHLQEATEAGLRPEAEKYERALARRLSGEAADIAAKYIRPPYSTDFALLFLPIEGIYQWLINQPALMQEMERKYRVTPCSPSTLTAVLNLVQLAHKSLAINHSESEVWQYLGNIRQELSNFDEAITKAQKKSAEMNSSLEKLGTRLRAIERRLNELEQLPQKSLD